ncbi:orotate phosphoribosyltransferase [Aminipila terrae]|uniref:Orotate phosphoribosyltransferase n=1 Tax=Aminipila terrae TaxID=2697030 RepID=A0A6P1MFL4_9FIRM|nr:orotate phosphoribosyltransferase [Aminipila terrae]QHI71374.1 orotate phosphoribosyltransferase [Aminipila terrae]
MSYKKQFIEFMVKSGVLTFGDFTTKSGRKTPYFVNTGNYKTGAQADKLGHFYASCIAENIKNGNISEDIAALFGPAYKGIPISVATAIAMSRDFDRDINYCFNRKEEKDHGEGGKMVGYKLQDGDSVLMVEDVITAGTAVRETLPQLMAAASVKVEGLIISVDRMERGQGQKTAIQEIEEEFGIKTYPLVTVREIIDTMHNNTIDGKIIIDDAMKERMEEYLSQYCVL